MTAGQTRVYLAIRELSAERGYSPTIREIGNLVGLSSTSTVKAHLEGLRRAGYVNFMKGSPRTIVITAKHPDAPEAA